MHTEKQIEKNPKQEERYGAPLKTFGSAMTSNCLLHGVFAAAVNDGSRRVQGLSKK